jgi:AcrR family transcriptional regulator
MFKLFIATCSFSQYLYRLISQSMNKKEKIFKSAIRLFSENGFHGTPTSKIAKEAGVANGTLFHYFSSKEALINELYVELKTELVHVSFKGLSETNELEVNLKQIWVSNINWAMQNKAKVIFLQQFINSPYLTEDTKKEVDALALAYFQMMEQALQEKKIRDIPFELIYVQATQQIFGVINFLLAQEDKSNKNEIIEHAYSMFWNGIKI